MLPRGKSRRHRGEQLGHAIDPVVGGSRRGGIEAVLGQLVGVCADAVHPVELPAKQPLRLEDIELDPAREDRPVVIQAVPIVDDDTFSSPFGRASRHGCYQGIEGDVEAPVSQEVGCLLKAGARP